VIALVLLGACGNESENHGAPAKTAERAVAVPAPAPVTEPAPPPVPAAAPGLYTLAEAPPELSLPVTHARYLVVAADDSIHIGVSGEAAFPGQAIDRTAVVQAFAPVVSGEAGPAAIDAGPPEDPAEGDELSGLAGQMTRAIPADAPLVLADGTRPAAEVIEIAADVGRISLAVGTAGDPAARALSATLSYLEQEPVAKGAIRLPLADPAAFATALAVSRTTAGPQAPVIVEVAPEVPMTGLVTALLALKRAQVDRFFLTTAAINARAAPDPRPEQSFKLDIGRDVTVGVPQVTGPAAPAAVVKVVRRRAGHLGACFHAALIDDPLFAPRLEVAFTVARAGKVAAVSVSGTTRTRFQRCVASELRGMRFARARAPSRVTLPLAFALR
jgi:hypothetical protein